MTPTLILIAAMTLGGILFAIAWWRVSRRPDHLPYVTFDDDPMIEDIRRALHADLDRP